MSEAAKTLFEQIISGGYASLCKMQQEKEIETELIDFKRLETDKGPLSNNDKKHFAKALSAFGNAGGGIVIWGVDCRKVAGGGPDVVRDLRPISDLRKAQADLYEFTSRLVMPAPIGVKHDLIKEDPAKDEGFVVTLIPSHDGPAVQNIHDEDYRFYYRSGESFKRMPQWMIADRFNRNPGASLALQMRFLGQRFTQNANQNVVPVVVSILNTGRKTARFITVRLAKENILEVLNPSVNSFQKVTQSDSFFTFVGEYRLSMKPQTSRETTDFKLHPMMNTSICTLYLDPALVAHSNGFDLAYEIYSDDFSLKETRFFPCQ